MDLSDILKPDDFSLVIRLGKKLDEYRSRLARVRPESSNEGYDSLCKIMVLDALLERGAVSYAQIREEIERNNPGIPDYFIVNAFMTIKVYAGQATSEYIHGGTGLPK